MRYVTMAAACLLLAGCATTTKVAVNQPGDNRLSCTEIKAEFAKLDRVQEEADDNKGVNTANVAAVLFFWPAAVGNWMDADKAEKLLQRRRDALMEHYKAKGC